MFAGLAVATIAVGLVVHRAGGALGPALRDATGDGLWAVMMYWIVGAVSPATRRTTRAAVALGICWLVEASQSYHSPGIDAVRATTLGHLVLGTDFDARDLVAYAAGVGAAWLAERASSRTFV